MTSDDYEPIDRDTARDAVAFVLDLLDDGKTHHAKSLLRSLLLRLEVDEAFEQRHAVATHYGGNEIVMQ